jgi:serine/threonine-protein phosphatase 2B catalytic subunit
MDEESPASCSLGPCRPIPSVIKQHFFDGGRLSPSDAIEILTAVTDLLASEPNILTLSDPITIVGDIHGQFYDLMTLFELGGDPGKPTQYLFLGDYVDRGSFSTEVALYLFSVKLAYPASMWLLRGNHECRHLTSYFNFKEECLHKYNEAVYDAFQTAFDALPLAAVLNDSYLCIHGGLSPDINSIDDISLVDRFREPPTSGAMCDLLWADPMEDEEEQLCPDALYLHNELRGCSYVFSFAAVRHFLEENKLMGVIRAHEAQDEGFRLFRKVEATGFPGVICIFSAPNYCDSYDNKASFLEISDKVLHIRQFHSVEHPYVLPNFMNAFTWSLPFVFDKLADLIRNLVAAGGAAQGSVDAVDDSDIDIDEEFEIGRSDPMMVNPVRERQSLAALLRILVGSRVLAERGRLILAKTRAVAKFLVLLRKLRTSNNKAGGRAPAGPLRMQHADPNPQ